MKQEKALVHFRCPSAINTDRQCRSGVVLLSRWWCWFGVEMLVSDDEKGIKVVYFAVSMLKLKSHHFEVMT